MTPEIRVPVDNQDKDVWCINSEDREQAFAKFCRERLNLDVIYNPEKIRDANGKLVDEKSKYLPDLIRNGNQWADMKGQDSPFFTAGRRYNVDPQWGCTFNRSVFERYDKLYPGIHIYFFVDWTRCPSAEAIRLPDGRLAMEKRPELCLYPIKGVWEISMEDIEDLIMGRRNGCPAPLHEYEQRVLDTDGNNRDSYILDLRDMNCLHHELPEELGPYVPNPSGRYKRPHGRI